MSPTPGDTAKPETDEKYPPLCVLCSNPILDEQESDITASAARYHVDCVMFESQKDRTSSRAERKAAAEDQPKPGNELPESPEPKDDRAHASHHAHGDRDAEQK